MVMNVNGYGVCSRGLCSCLNSPQGVIIVSALIGLLLVEVLDKDTLENSGNVILAIGQLMIAAAGFC